MWRRQTWFKIELKHLFISLCNRRATPFLHTFYSRVWHFLSKPIPCIQPHAFCYVTTHLKNTFGRPRKSNKKVRKRGTLWNWVLRCHFVIGNNGRCIFTRPTVSSSPEFGPRRTFKLLRHYLRRSSRYGHFRNACPVFNDAVWFIILRSRRAVRFSFQNKR